VLSAEGGKLAGTPVLDVVRRVSETPEVLTAEEVPEAEERLMRNTQQAPPARDAPDLLEGAAGILEVLQHLQAHHEIVSSAPNGQRAHVTPHERHARAARPGVLKGRRVQLHPVDPGPRDPLGEVPYHDPFAAPHFEDSAGRVGLDHLAHAPKKSRDEPADDRIGRPVLPFVVAPLSRDGQPSRDRIETSSALRAW